MSDELNPTHPVTQALHEDWHKIVALLLWKYAHTTDATITEADLENFTRQWPDCVVLVHAKATELHVRLLPRAEGERLAQEAAR